MSKERPHHFTRRNMELDATFYAPVDPTDEISEGEQTENHYSRIREFRQSCGASPEARAAKVAYREDEREMSRLQQKYENRLIDEVIRTGTRCPQKQLRLLKKDGLDKKAYQALLPLSRDVERTQERCVA